MKPGHHRNALRRRRPGAASSAGEDLARAHAAAPDRGVADEERLRPVAGRAFSFRADCRSTAPCWRSNRRARCLRGPRTASASSRGRSRQRRAAHLRMEQVGFRHGAGVPRCSTAGSASSTRSNRCWHAPTKPRRLAYEHNGSHAVGAYRRADRRHRRLARQDLRRPAPDDPRRKRASSRMEMDGQPVWSCDGMIAVANAHKGKVKLTFMHGAQLPIPTSCSTMASTAMRGARSISSKATSSTSER